MLNTSIESRFRSELLPDEKFVWTGQPEASVIFAKGDIFLIPFSLVWASFIFGSLKDILSTSNFQFPFSLFILFFIIIGIYFTFGRFIVKILKKRKTYYAVTNKRILILTDFFGRNFQAAYIDNLPAMNKSMGWQGTGSIIFGNSNFSTGTYANTGMDFWGNTNNLLAFYDIKDVNGVYQKINTSRSRKT